MDEGHCGLPDDELRRRAAELLEILVAIVDVALALELGEGMVVAAPPPTTAAAVSSLGSDGPAAMRLSEATGLEAMALHRLLEADPAQRGFQRGEDHPLAAVQRMRVRGLDGAVRPHLSTQPPARTGSAGRRCRFHLSLCIFRSGRSGQSVPR